MRPSTPLLAALTLLLLLLLTGTAPHRRHHYVDAAFPNTFPYMDTCYGKVQDNCKPNDKDGDCKFFQDQYPQCFNADYAKLTQQRPMGEMGAASKYFSFSAGVHLSEGTHQRIFINYSPDDCAMECLRSAKTCPDNVRCLSFDFYPYEEPKYTPPWSESGDRGVCVLNNENKDSARLRNSDLGYSDASLYYRTHFSYLPFADQEGYYEVRDPRGGELAWLLNYGANNELLAATVNVWGGSRWGIYHLQVPNRNASSWVTECPPAGDFFPGDLLRPAYHGGYTPLDEDQHCVGLTTFTETEQLCMQTGGRLCTDPELMAMIGVKLGCGFDGPVRNFDNLINYPIWSESDRNRKDRTKTKKYPRCCADYTLLDSCWAYVDESVFKECKQYKTATDCVQLGSGTRLQYDQGMGIFMDSLRQDCERNTGACKGLVREWAPRDRCVWCPTSGLMDGGGAGECRAGSSLAVCPGAPQLLRETWINTVRTHEECQPVAETVCRLLKYYPDLGSSLLDPQDSNFTRSPTLSARQTLAPTFNLPQPDCVPPPAPPSPSPVDNTGIDSGGDDFPTLQPTFSASPCYTLRNFPAACDARPDCAYDTKKKTCGVRRQGRR